VKHDGNPAQSPPEHKSFGADNAGTDAPGPDLKPAVEKDSLIPRLSHPERQMKPRRASPHNDKIVHDYVTAYNRLPGKIPAGEPIET
jgi:hypothetical protein